MNISRNNDRPGLLVCFLAVGGLFVLPAPDLLAQGAALFIEAASSI